MKKSITIFALTTQMVLSAIAQQNAGSVPNGVTPSTLPANISSLEARGRLITQNSQQIPFGNELTGSFANTARWNSMGNLNAGSQILNGFRTQTNGRALVLGHSIPNGGSVSNTFVQWGGNQPLGISPGNLEFRSFRDPQTPSTDTVRFLLRENGTAHFGRTPLPLADNNPFVSVENTNDYLAVDATGLSVFNQNTNVINPNGPVTSSVGVNSLAVGRQFSFAPSEGGVAFGVRSQASAGISYGVYGESLSSSNGFSAGVYGVSGVFTGYAGYFDGNVFATGMFMSSDKKLKTNITKQASVLEKIVGLNPVTYEYKTAETKFLHLPSGKQNGFVAQELEEVFPELVKDVTKPLDPSKNNYEMATFKSVN